MAQANSGWTSGVPHCLGLRECRQMMMMSFICSSEPMEQGCWCDSMVQDHQFVQASSKYPRLNPAGFWSAVKACSTRLALLSQSFGLLKTAGEEGYEREVVSAQESAHPFQGRLDLTGPPLTVVWAAQDCRRGGLRARGRLGPGLAHPCQGRLDPTGPPLTVVWAVQDCSRRGLRPRGLLCTGLAQQLQGLLDQTGPPPQVVWASPQARRARV
jgi:hypothetical protein